jgi:hypothetical protein
LIGFFVFWGMLLAFGGYAALALPRVMLSFV